MVFDWLTDVKDNGQIVLEEVSRIHPNVNFVHKGHALSLDLSKTVSSHPYKASVDDEQLTKYIKSKQLRVESSKSKTALKRKLYITEIK